MTARVAGGPVALFLPDVQGGGAERVMVQLARDLSARGHEVDLVLGRARGKYLEEVPAAVDIVELGVDRALACLPPLIGYLRRRRPVALLSTMNHVNPVAIAAARLSRVPARVVVREASNVSGQLRDADTWRGKLTPLAMRVAYRAADRVIAVSEAAKQDLLAHTGLDAARVSVVYNPVDYEALRARAAEAADHPWLAQGEPPVVLAVGRLSPEKGFDVLIDAVAPLVRAGEGRLLICGEGSERRALEARCRRLGVEEHVALPGFVENPYAYIARSRVLALPSRWEGLPNVLIHALALGVAVVATDCPGGSSEILEGGKHGALVPVDDAAALRRALRGALERPEPPRLDDAWRARFAAQEVVTRYEAALGLA